MAVEYNQYNPIRTVDGAYVPVPHIYEWSEDDISDENAGRTEDAKMHKNRVAQIRTLHLSWDGLKTDEISAVLTAFDPEYVQVQYLDAKAGAYTTDTFYVGGRHSSIYNAKTQVWGPLTFDVIMQ